MMENKIKLLSQLTINRIAAGEVLERPASAIKELVENAIDANAKNIDVFICNSGGRNLMIVSDDGIGMNSEDLSLAIERHTTSKLNEDDLFDISSFGFRGEALPSIASVSKMTITSKKYDSENAYSLNIIGGLKQDLKIASLTKGTKIEVRDLFFATPVRLKFLKSERSEQQFIIEIINKIALAHYPISFSLSNESKNIFKYKSQDNLKDRVKEIMGEEFIQNSAILDYQKEEIYVKGFTTIPTYNRGTSSEQYLFVNNRAIKDKVIISAIKIAYLDYLAKDRHPMAVIFIDMPLKDVDVNVHPAKTEVRFKDSNLIKFVIINAIKKAISKESNKTSTSLSTKAIEYIVKSNTSNNKIFEQNFNFNIPKKVNYIQSLASEQDYNKELLIDKKEEDISKTGSDIIQSKSIEKSSNEFYLGIAKAQIYDNYIISQKPDSIVIIDQHAAHERLIYEKLKFEMKNHGMKRQRLLIPEVIELQSNLYELFIEHQQKLSEMGITINKCGVDTIMVTEIPALIQNCNVQNLIKNIADDLIEYSQNITLVELNEHILETYACHHSIRAGRKLDILQMNQLLREMEEVPFSGQCNHGRPTYIELKLIDIEKLFGRS